MTCCFFSSFKTLLTSTEATPRVRVNVLGDGLSVAGFQVIISGRFWVITEASGRFDANRIHFQLALLAYNLNGWLLLFNREEQSDVTQLQHTTLATSRRQFLFIAAKIWRQAGRTGVSYSDHYEEKGVFQRLMDRLRRIAPRGGSYAPVMTPALC